MTTGAVLTWRLIGLFILGCVLFSYPVLTMFSVKTMLFGIPLLYLYIFISWMMIIVFLYLVSRKSTKKRQQAPPDSFFISDPDK